MSAGVAPRPHHGAEWNDSGNDLVRRNALRDRLTAGGPDEQEKRVGERRPDGRVALYEYDLPGTPTKETPPHSALSQWTYDLPASPATLTAAKRAAATFEYDRSPVQTSTYTVSPVGVAPPNSFRNPFSGMPGRSAARPRICLFGQEDPAGTGDSTNRYQALRAAWMTMVDPGGQFSVQIHESIVHEASRSLGLSEDLISALKKAQSEADLMHPANSAQHFDDNDFAGGTQLVGDFLRKFHSEKEPHAAASAFGRALHAMHDFYSHSNYVELRVSTAPSSSIALWDFIWPATDRDLRPTRAFFSGRGLNGMPVEIQGGLRSGSATVRQSIGCSVFGVDSYCNDRRSPDAFGVIPAGHYGGSGLNKDTPESPAGMLWAPNGQRLFFVARDLAVRQTQEVMRKYLEDLRRTSEQMRLMEERAKASREE